MPKCFVNDINIWYEAYGSGDTIVYLQSVLGGINPGAYYFAGRLSENFKVIIWDGPNCGQSGMTIRKTLSEYHLHCEYLAALLDAIGERSVHIAGCSGGGEMGLLFAHLYPDKVKSLAMYRPTDTSCELEREIVKARYFDIAEASKVSMCEVVEFSKNPPKTRFGNISRWIAEVYFKNGEKILDIDNKEFSEIMTSWGKWMSDPLFYRACLDDEKLAKIKIPVLIFPCSDDYHPERLAVDLHNGLPNSVYIPSIKHRLEREIYDADNADNPFGGFVDFVDAYQEFMR
ncbi:MAG: alpha/beta hydrolase [Oscillospiraceae bacterium]|nr:alpha/beta hydrolase [Oscillospiraceae bacterium]